MQTISLNKITQYKHTKYNALDIGRFDKNGEETDFNWYAPEDCTVTEIHTKDDNSCGKYIRFTGATGAHTICHNEAFYVKVGQKVKRGEKMAKMGYTGYTQPDNVSSGRHAHWIINKNNVWVYPLSKINETFTKEGMPMMNKGDVVNMYRALLKRNPDPAGLKAFTGQPWNTVFYKIIHSKEYAEKN